MPWSWSMINFGATLSSFASSWTRVFPAISATPFDRLRSLLPLAQESTEPRDRLGRRHGMDSERLGPPAPPHALRQTCLSPTEIGSASADPPLGIGLDQPVHPPDDPEQLRLGASPTAAEAGPYRRTSAHRSTPSPGAGSAGIASPTGASAALPGSAGAIWASSQAPAAARTTSALEVSSPSASR